MNLLPSLSLPFLHHLYVVVVHICLGHGVTGVSVVIKINCKKECCLLHI